MTTSSTENLLQQLQRAAQSPRGLRFLDRGENATWLPYADLYSQALGVAGALRRLGLQAGDRVGLVLPTAPSFFEAFYGVQAAGCIPVPLYPPVRLGRLDEYHQRTTAMLRACGARLLLTDRRIRRILGSTIEAADLALGAVAMETLETETEPPAEPNPDDLALIQFSSGTTVDPKPVALTHTQVLANVRALLGTIVDAYPEGEGRVHAGVSWLPLYHDMGLVGCALSAVSHPGDLTLIPPEVFVTHPAIWLRALSKYRGTISPAPNFAYSLCVERISDDDLENVDLSSWHVALNGAEPVAPTTLRRFIDRFEPYGLSRSALSPVYGLAEATLAVTFSDLHREFGSCSFDRRLLSEAGKAVPTDAGGHDLVSLGRPLAGFDLRIRANDGTQLPEGRLGQVWVRGPSVMHGYFEQPDRTQHILQDGWLDTGDTGFMWRGELYLFGRAKDLVILRGRNHAPQDIELALDGLPGLRTGCAAAGGTMVPGTEGEVLVVLAERRATTPKSAELRLSDQASRRITEVCGLVPWRVKILPPGTLPRTSSGKIRRQEAIGLYLRQQLKPPARVTPWGMVLRVLRSQVALWRSERKAGDAPALESEP